MIAHNSAAVGDDAARAVTYVDRRLRCASDAKIRCHSCSKNQIVKDRGPTRDRSRSRAASRLVPAMLAVSSRPALGGNPRF